MEAKQWVVDVFIDEDGDVTTAHARLRTRDRTHLEAHGSARRHPRDVAVSEIGDELAAARALSHLAHRLLDAAAGDIEAITRERVVLEQ